MALRNKIVDTVIDDVEHKVLVPSDLPEGKGLESAGIIVGPPNLKLAGFELDADAILSKLQHELFVRGVITYSDAKQRRQDVFGALFAALKLDVDNIVEAYKEHNSHG